MVPWETLRRLLGLPRDMAPPDTAELARLAIAEPRHARLVAMALRGRVPKEAPAAMLIAAHERGALPSHRVAELLGCVGHASGYRAVLAMLYSADETDACAAAGVAAARILGRRADADLIVALSAGPDRVHREGAALGLSEIGTEEAAASVVEAGRDGRVRMRLAIRCAVRMPFDADFWLDQLESPRLRDRRYGTHLVYELLASPASSGAREHLDALGDRAKSAVRGALSDPELYMLPEKRELLARWIA